MATIQKYNFPDHMKGDTFNGIEFTVVVNSSAVDLTDASIRMFLKKQGNPTVIFERFTTDNGKLTITDAVNGVFQFDNQIININAGTYDYDIEITFSNGTVKTYIKGTWKIIQDITTNG